MTTGLEAWTDSTGSPPRRAWATASTRETTLESSDVMTAQPRSGRAVITFRMAQSRPAPPTMRRTRQTCAMIGQLTMKPVGPHAPDGKAVTLPAAARSATFANSVWRVGVTPGANWVRCTSHSGL